MENFRIRIWIRKENFRFQDPDPYNNSYGSASLMVLKIFSYALTCSSCIGTRVAEQRLFWSAIRSNFIHHIAYDFLENCIKTTNFFVLLQLLQDPEPEPTKKCGSCFASNQNSLATGGTSQATLTYSKTTSDKDLQFMHISTGTYLCSVDVLLYGTVYSCMRMYCNRIAHDVVYT